MDDLTDNLLSKNSPLTTTGSVTTGFDFRTQTQRGLITPYQAGALYDISNAGTVSPLVLGAAGSGTETLIITSTLTSLQGDMLFATHEMDFYEGTVSASGTANIFGASSSVPYANYIIMHWNSWGASDQLNVVAKNICRNTKNSTTTVNMVDQWRYLIPPVSLPGGKSPGTS